jgi:hypothetical protein
MEITAPGATPHEAAKVVALRQTYRKLAVELAYVTLNVATSKSEPSWPAPSAGSWVARSTPLLSSAARSWACSPG